MNQENNSKSENKEESNNNLHQSNDKIYSDKSKENPSENNNTVKKFNHRADFKDSKGIIKTILYYSTLIFALWLFIVLWIQFGYLAKKYSVNYSLNPPRCLNSPRLKVCSSTNANCINGGPVFSSQISTYSNYVPELTPTVIKDEINLPQGTEIPGVKGFNSFDTKGETFDESELRQLDYYSKYDISDSCYSDEPNQKECNYYFFGWHYRRCGRNDYDQEKCDKFLRWLDRYNVWNRLEGCSFTNYRVKQCAFSLLSKFPCLFIDYYLHITNYKDSYKCQIAYFDYIFDWFKDQPFCKIECQNMWEKQKKCIRKIFEHIENCGTNIKCYSNIDNIDCHNLRRLHSVLPLRELSSSIKSGFPLPLGMYQIFQYIFLLAFIILFSIFLFLFCYKTLYDTKDNLFELIYENEKYPYIKYIPAPLLFLTDLVFTFYLSWKITVSDDFSQKFKTWKNFNYTGIIFTFFIIAGLMYFSYVIKKMYESSQTQIFNNKLIFHFKDAFLAIYIIFFWHYFCYTIFELDLYEKSKKLKDVDAYKICNIVLPVLFTGGAIGLKYLFANIYYGALGIFVLLGYLINFWAISTDVHKNYNTQYIGGIIAIIMILFWIYSFYYYFKKYKPSYVHQPNPEQIDQSKKESNIENKANSEKEVCVDNQVEINQDNK